MPERRECPRFAFKYILANVPFTLLAFGAFWFMWRDWSVQGPRFSIAATVFGGCIAVLILMDWYRFRHFRCPNCGTTLPKPDFRELQPDDSIAFLCESCDIEWHPGVYVPYD